MAKKVKILYERFDFAMIIFKIIYNVYFVHIILVWVYDKNGCPSVKYNLIGT